MIRATRAGAPLDSPVFTGISDFSAGGAYFGTAAAANLLDDYEEGTFTPTFSNMGTGTYTAQVGSYTKVGDMVYCQVTINVSAVGTASGDLIIAGLPFTSNATSDWNGVSSAIRGNGWTTGRASLVGYMGASATTILLYYGSSSAAIPKPSHADFGTGEMQLSVTYKV